MNRDVLRIASRQRGMVTRAQLLEIGFGETSIETRLVNGRFLPVAAGLYAVGRKLRSRRSTYLAAVLGSGPGSYLSGMSAADLWGFRRHSGIVEVTRAESRSPRTFWLDPAGVARPRLVRVRRSRTLKGRDLSDCQGVPILSPARVLLDLAGVLPEDELAKAFKEADRLGQLREVNLFDCARRGSGWRGVASFRRLVGRRHPATKDARSLLEVLFLGICATHDLGRPEVNAANGRYYPDFTWKEIGLIVEVDGYEGHAGRMAFLEDAHRENELRADGFQLIRFTWEEITERPDWVASLVRLEIDRCRITSGGDPTS